MVAKVFQLVPLIEEKRAALPTFEAARHLNRAPQTLLLWACKDCGPLRPIRVNGRLAWPVPELRKLLGIEDCSGAPNPKRFATVQAQAALAGISLEHIETDDGRNAYVLTRDHLTCTLPDLDAVKRLLATLADQPNPFA